MARKKFLWLLLPVAMCLFLESERKIPKSGTAEHETAIKPVGRAQETGRDQNRDLTSSQGAVSQGETPRARPEEDPQEKQLPKPEMTSAQKLEYQHGSKSQGRKNAQLQRRSQPIPMQMDITQPEAEGAEEAEGGRDVYEVPEDYEPSEAPGGSEISVESETSGESETPGESEISEQPCLPEDQRPPAEPQTAETDHPCEETGHTWGAETDVFGDGTMFRKECTQCGAWEKRTAVFTDPVEFWWIQWTDKEGNVQRREFDTYEECREAEEGLEGAWNFGNDYREELTGWEVTSSDGYQYWME